MDVNTYMVPITATVKGYEANIQSVDTNPRNIEVNIQDVTGKNSLYLLVQVERLGMDM